MHCKFTLKSIPLKLICYLGIFLIFSSSCSTKSKKIPVISNDIALQVKEIDTLYFTNQLNNRFLINSLKGDVHVVNFFFTTCTTICPLMEVPLNDLAKKHKNVKFISFTIDPDRDSSDVLKKYHDLHKQSNQTLLRGTKEDLSVISKIYLNAIDIDSNEDLYHTTNVVLVDQKLNIRGIYDSLDPEDIAFLEEDINILLKNQN